MRRPSPHDLERDGFERTKFLLEWERRWNEAEGGLVNMAELCGMFGISRQTGYTWSGRYREANHGVRAVEERSRRLHRRLKAEAAPVALLAETSLGIFA
ncbi:MAG: hypothetical protein HY698_09730 [Deltaproteobacteria bacterium]|nr:hypothetical protein [Deltaproteobacteria bacterium]